MSNRSGQRALLEIFETNLREQLPILKEEKKYAQIKMMAKDVRGLCQELIRDEEDGYLNYINNPSGNTNLQSYLMDKTAAKTKDLKATLAWAENLIKYADEHAEEE